MAVYYKEPSRTFGEYLLIPNLTTKGGTPDKISLKTPLVKHKKGKKPAIELNIPFSSAVMQAVSGQDLAIALARCGGISFIFGSQPIEEQAEMIRKVKRFKAGFVISDSNLGPDNIIEDAYDMSQKTGHTTIAITKDGTSNGKLLGILTSRDFRYEDSKRTAKIKDFMTPLDKMHYGTEGITLDEANDLIWEHKLNTLPIVDRKGNLKYLVFRKDYDQHKENPYELVDDEKRLIVGAGINTRDYEQRVPALIEAGVDILCIDSSDGYSEWQSETIKFIKKNYNIPVGAGNVVDEDGFKYLVEAGADFIKVGIGGGSICITREQKGIGRGQATSVMEVAKARDAYYQKTGMYVPICSDGGIVHDYHIVLALAMGADFVMLGRYFARFDESPSRKLRINGSYVKEYWGEGSNRARNWQRYSDGKYTSRLAFEEGVDVYVPYAGKLKDNLDTSLTKIKSTMINCGSNNIPELQDKAKITLVSSVSIREGGAHDVIQKENEFKMM